MLSPILHEYMHCMCAHSMQWKWLKLDHLILATPVAAKSDTLACTSPLVEYLPMQSKIKSLLLRFQKLLLKAKGQELHARKFISRGIKSIL